MTKQEFLSGLETALSGEVSQQTFLSNMQYYRSYIEDEIRKGRSEAEVMEELGSPRLIARTIIDAAGAETGGFGQETDAAGQDGMDSRDQGRYGRSPGVPEGFRLFPVGFAGCLLLAVILVIFLLAGVPLVISSILRLISAFPGLAILGLVWYIIYARRNGRF